MKFHDNPSCMVVSLRLQSNLRSNLTPSTFFHFQEELTGESQVGKSKEKPAQ